jgi:hypothetical protein
MQIYRRRRRARISAERAADCPPTAHRLRTNRAPPRPASHFSTASLGVAVEAVPESADARTGRDDLSPVDLSISRYKRLRLAEALEPLADAASHALKRIRAKTSRISASSVRRRPTDATHSASLRRSCPCTHRRSIGDERTGAGSRRCGECSELLCIALQLQLIRGPAATLDPIAATCRPSKIHPTACPCT